MGIRDQFKDKAERLAAQGKQRGEQAHGRSEREEHSRAAADREQLDRLDRDYDARQ